MMAHSIDNHGLITEVSDRWLAKLGYTWDEVIGRPSTSFLTEQSARYAREIVLPAFFETGACDVEYEMRHKDGSVLPVRLHGVAVRSESGAFERSIAVIEDLTERRALEHKVFEVQKLESLGLMAGNIAHDFNNLLASVIGSAELAVRHAAHIPAAASALDNVLLASARAAELCRQLLAYSGRGRFEVSVLQLDALVAEMVQVLAVTAGSRTRVELDLASNGAWVEVDATQIRQTVMNLVLNAADAIGGSAGTITLRTARVELDAKRIAESLRPDTPPGVYLGIAVSDDGCGMSEEVRAHVFDPFFTTKATGRGLGLAATLGIVRGHRGTLTLTSVVGKGSCFTIYVPLAPAPAPAVAPVRPSPPPRPRGTVLIVDDDELLRSTIARQLTEAGFHTLTAASGGEALTLFETTSGIEACVIDVSMPDMSGPQLATKILEGAPAAEIVLMSGFDRVDVRQAPHARFLRKPFTEEELVIAVSRRRPRE